MNTRTIVKRAVLYTSAVMAVGSCSEALTPTGDVAVGVVAVDWPDTLAVGEIATLAAAVTDQSGASIVGLSLAWATTDSAIMTIVAVPGASSGDSARAVITSHAVGSATVVARVARTGFDSAEVRARITVAQGAFPKQLTVSKVDTIGIAVTRASPGIVGDRKIEWQVSDQSLLLVTTLGVDSAIVTPKSSGPVQITATVTGSRLGRSVFQFPVNLKSMTVGDAGGVMFTGAAGQPGATTSWPSTMTLGDSVRLDVIVFDADSQPMSGVPKEWRSTNSQTLQVDERTGVVRALRQGAAEIVATVGDRRFQTAEFRRTIVVEPVSVGEGQNWPDTLTVTDSTTVLTVRVRDANGNVVPNPKVAWSSTNTAAFTIDAVTGRLTAYNQGGGQVVATVGDPTKVQTVEFRGPITVLPLTPSPVEWHDTLTVTDTARFRAVALDAFGNPRPNVPVRWVSTNNSAFTIDASGNAIAFSQGGGQIVASVGAAPYQVSEYRGSVASLPLSVSPLGTWPTTINLNNDTTLRVVVRNAFGQVRTGFQAQWRSSNEAALSVGLDGKVTALNRGSGDIIATVGTAPFQTSEFRTSIRVLLKWNTLDAGAAHTCGVTARDSTGYCWGSNFYSQLGTGSPFFQLQTTPGVIATLRRFEQIDAGVGASYAGDFVSPFVPESHTCGRTKSELQCWGTTTSGQVGVPPGGACTVGLAFNCVYPVPVTVATLGQVTVAGQLTRVATYDHIAAGGRASCAQFSAIFVASSITCWGLAPGGGLGLLPLDAPVINGDNFQARVLAGGSFVCTNKQIVGRNILCFGSNDRGQSGDALDQFVRDGQGNLLPMTGSIAGGQSGGGNHACSISGVPLLCWGSNEFGQLGAASGELCSGIACSHTALQVPLASVTQVSAGFNHTCALVASGDVYCWGSNVHGQLGRATAGAFDVVPRVVSGGLRFQLIAAGGAHTCGLTLDGSVYCWGFNQSGQLGDGTTVLRTSPVRVIDPP
jgi:uncharacterized protein YjdB